MLQLEGVVFHYPPMVMRFDLEVGRGLCCAVIGPSGAGKSTLLALIAGFERLQAGTVSIDGRDVTALPPAKRPVTTLFQEHNLFGHLDVTANVGLGIDPGLRLKDADRRRIEAALARVGLGGKGDRKPAQLSGGERQRVAVARALILAPSLLLCDEPTGSLDPKTAASVADLLFELHGDEGNVMIVVTHSRELAERFERRLTLG